MTHSLCSPCTANGAAEDMHPYYMDCDGCLSNVNKNKEADLRIGLSYITFTVSAICLPLIRKKKKEKKKRGYT